MIRRRKALARATKPIRKRRPGKPRRGPADIPAGEWRCKPFRDFLAAVGQCSACVAMLKDPALVPGPLLGQLRPGMAGGYCDPAHGPVNGASSKGPDSGCIPLCRGFGLLNHHDEQHAMGWPAFQAKYTIDRELEAAVWWRLWRLLQSP